MEVCCWARSISFLWLEFSDCAGDSKSMLRATKPTIAEIVLDVISPEYHETIIDIVPLSGVCNECRSPFELEEAHVFAGPLCACRSFKIEQGYELEIVEMEVN